MSSTSRSSIRSPYESVQTISAPIYRYGNELGSGCTKLDNFPSLLRLLTCYSSIILSEDLSLGGIVPSEPASIGSHSVYAELLRRLAVSECSLSSFHFYRRRRRNCRVRHYVAKLDDGSDVIRALPPTRRWQHKRATITSGIRRTRPITGARRARRLAAYIIVDSLCDDCRAHFDAVMRMLDALRGIDYNTLDPTPSSAGSTTTLRTTRVRRRRIIHHYAPPAAALTRPSSCGPAGKPAPGIASAACLERLQLSRATRKCKRRPFALALRRSLAQDRICRRQTRQGASGR